MRNIFGHIGISAEQYSEEVPPMNYDVTFQDEGDTAVIDIEGYIGRDILRELLTGEKSKNTAENLKEEIRSFSAEKIIVNIHSPGGDLSEGLVIKELLQAKQAEVVTNLQGFSASAATVIHQAGDNRRMSRDSFELIHRAMFGVMGFINQNTTRALTDNLETIDNQMIRMYDRRSSVSKKDITNLMDEGEGYGKWIDAETALDMGLIDEIYDPADDEDQDIDRLENKKKAAQATARFQVNGTDIDELNPQKIAELFGVPQQRLNEQDDEEIEEEESATADEARSRTIEILKLKHTA
jgi:ATP-dependent protease ClpP protease subunit